MLGDVKPCPWCGDNDNLATETDLARRWIWVICGCGARGPDVRNNYKEEESVGIKRAIDEWNNRK